MWTSNLKINFVTYQIWAATKIKKCNLQIIICLVETIHKIIINLEVSHHFKTSLSKMLNPFLTTKIRSWLNVLVSVDPALRLVLTTLWLVFQFLKNTSAHMSFGYTFGNPTRSEICNPTLDSWDGSPVTARYQTTTDHGVLPVSQQNIKMARTIPVSW